MRFRVNPLSIVAWNVKKLFAQNRCDMWSFSDNNEIRTSNHLLCKRTPNHLAKLPKLLSYIVSTYLYGGH